MYSAITIDRGGQSHHGWRSFRFRQGRLQQTVFYLHRLLHDEQDYAVPLETGTGMAAIDEAAQRLLGQMIDDARRPGDQPAGDGA